MSSDALSLAQNKLEIQFVRLRSSSTSLRDDQSAEGFSLKTFSRQHYQIVGRIEETQFESFYNYSFFVHIGFRALEAANEAGVDEEEAALLLKATFEVIYRSDVAVDKDCLEAFSEENVLYHAWPYWREWCQSQCARLGIVNIPMATIRLKQTK